MTNLKLFIASFTGHIEKAERHSMKEEIILEREGNVHMLATLLMLRLLAVKTTIPGVRKCVTVLWPLVKKSLDRNC